MATPLPGSGRYLRCGWLLVIITAVSAATLLAFAGLQFPWRDAVEPALITTALCLGAAIYRKRQVPQFEMALSALALITTYTAFYSVLMYAIAAVSGSMTDLLLQRWDAACGVHLPEIVAWSQAHPALNRAFRWAYDSVMLQTTAVIIVLSFTSDARALRGFVIQFMVAALLTMGLFAYFPADGPCACFDYVVDPGLDRYVTHIRELKSGVRTVVSWRNAEGLVTFPSFHTTWAILLAWAVRRRRGLNVLALALNVAVVLSTMTLGLHYFIDVPGGTAVAIAAIAIESRIARWCLSQPAAGPNVAAPQFGQVSDADLEELRAASRELQEA